MIGRKFGLLTVVEQAKSNRGKRWKCVCECGNETVVYGYRLKSGHTRSCGCLLRKPPSKETRQKIGDALRNQKLFTCDYCGEKSSKKPSHYARNKRNFCSPNCYHDYLSAYNRGENHPLFGTGMAEDEVKKRIRARTRLNHAVRDGKLERLPCVVCGDVAEAHHEDYNKPLDVTWLCRMHHRIYHNNPELLEVLSDE